MSNSNTLGKLCFTSALEISASSAEQLCDGLQNPCRAEFYSCGVIVRSLATGITHEVSYSQVKKLFKKPRRANVDTQEMTIPMWPITNEFGWN